MTPPIISLSHVSRRFAGGTIGLHDVDMTIERGELVAIVGPSGSGKSTMLNIIGTLDRATGGTLEFDGHDVAGLRDNELSALRAHRIGFVFQHFQLQPGTSAFDNVADGLLYTGMAQGERRRRAASALQRVGLEHRLHHRPYQMSGGEKQRTAIARAVVREPWLLLADEPTGALDSQSGDNVLKLLLDLHAAGTAVVVITHDRDLASRFARQVSMRDGRIVNDNRSSR